MYMSEKIRLSFQQLGLQIQTLREERNLSVKDLSQITGIRKEYLKKIETGTAYGVMIERHLVKIARALNVKISELFNYK